MHPAPVAAVKFVVSFFSDYDLLEWQLSTKKRRETT
jgi:hypothetical protein